MEFSSHYPPFAQKTVIILTNTQRARFLCINGREVEEEKDVTIDIPETADFDSHKAAQLTELGKRLSKKLSAILSKGDYPVVTLCVPEVNREQLQSAIDPKILPKITSIIPKNLCAMELATVMRILLEG